MDPGRLASGYTTDDSDSPAQLPIPHPWLVVHVWYSQVQLHGVHDYPEDAIQ